MCKCNCLKHKKTLPKKHDCKCKSVIDTKGVNPGRITRIKSK